MITKPREKCPPRDRNLLALAVVLGIGGGLVAYQGVANVRDASAQPGMTANITLDAAETPDLPAAAAPAPNSASVAPEETPAPAPIVARQPVEGGSGSAAPAPAPAAEPAELAPEPTLEQRLADALRLLEAYRGAKDKATERLALFAFIAGVGWLLIAVLKAATPLGSEKWKKRIPLVVLGLGVAVALFASLAAGQSWAVAAFYGAGPPLATFIQELIKVFKD